MPIMRRHALPCQLNSWRVGCSDASTPLLPHISPLSILHQAVLFLPPHATSTSIPFFLVL
jgi:hypothetical protein